jgi:hypothetical protein
VYIVVLLILSVIQVMPFDDFFMENASAATLDYIRIEDWPNGTELFNVIIPVGGQIRIFASGYNFSTGFIGLILVNWSQIPILGSFDEQINESTVFTAGSTGGSTTITAENMTGVLQDSFIITILDPTIDSIRIRDGPGGTGNDLCNVANYPIYTVGHTTIFYGAAYNNTVGYIGDVNSSSIWDSTNISIVEVSSPGNISFIWCNNTGGSVWITLDDGLGHSNLTQVTVLPPTVDYITIVDTPDVGFSVISNQAVDMGFTISGYAAGFNDTAWYIGDVLVNWSVNNVDSTSFTLPLSGMNSMFYADFNSGTATWIADDGYGHIDTVIFTINPPTVDYIEITDMPNGTQLLGGSVPVGFSEWGNASLYNNTYGYLDTVSANWTLVGGTSFLLGGTPAFSNGVDVGTTPVDVYFNASYYDGTNWHNDSVVYNVQAPTVDYIEITDFAGGPQLTGGPVGYNFQEWGNCSLYNDTYGYLGPVSANWTAEGGSSSLLGSTPEFYNGIDVGTTAVSVWLNASYWFYTDSVQYIVQAPAPEVDYIRIVDTPSIGNTTISDQNVSVGQTILGYAAAFNNSLGYLYDISVSWSVANSGGAIASTNPPSATSSTFNAGIYGGNATWWANDGSGNLDSVQIIIDPPTIDYISIVSNEGNGTPVILDQTLGIDFNITGFAAGFNYTVGYIGDISVTWSVTNFDGANASTGPLVNSNSTFSSGSTNGNATWTADDGDGHNNVTQFTIEGQIVNPIDYIIITDGPDGTPLTDVTLSIGESIIAYASGYDSAGPTFIDLVEVNWNEVPSNLGNFNISLGKSVEFTAFTSPGSVNITGQNLSMSPVVSDNFTVNILPPTIDFMRVTDTANGNEHTTVNIGGSDSLDAYASGYNNTGPTFVQLVDVNWTGGGGTWTPTTGTSSSYTAGTTSGLFVQTAENVSTGLSDTFSVDIFIDTDPPSIVHTIVTVGSAGEPISITTDITDSESGVDTVSVFYKKPSEGTYTELPMNFDGNNYTAEIPGSSVTMDGLEYYIKADDNAIPTNIAYFGVGGQTGTQPGSSTDINITIMEADNDSPSISHTPVTSGFLNIPIAISVDVVDDISGVKNVYLHYKKSTDSTYIQIQMNVNGNTYLMDIPGSAVNLAGVEYYIMAVDNAVTPNVVYFGANGQTGTEPTSSTDIDIAITEDDEILPWIESKSPEGSNILIETMISVTFSEAMDKASTELAFSISPSINGSFLWDMDDITLTFDPISNLNYQTEYTVTITSGATDLAGNSLPVAQTWKFTTEGGPHIVSTTPLHFSVDISVDTIISIVFSETMNENSVEEAFSISPDADVMFNPKGVIIEFKPTPKLEYNTKYTITISPNATSDLSGKHLSGEYVFEFVTEPKPQDGQSSFWETWEPIITGIMILASLIAFLIGLVSLRRKRSKLRQYMEKIDETFNEYKREYQTCEKELITLREDIKGEVKRGKLEENHFLILDKKIDDYLIDMKVQKEGSAAILLSNEKRMDEGVKTEEKPEEKPEQKPDEKLEDEPKEEPQEEMEEKSNDGVGEKSEDKKLEDDREEIDQ